jgi:hypothetical protein
VLISKTLKAIRVALVLSLMGYNAWLRWELYKLEEQERRRQGSFEQRVAARTRWNRAAAGLSPDPPHRPVHKAKGA